MKTLKKFFRSALVAATAMVNIFTVTPIMSASASQIWWKQGDINGDGVVEMSDLILFNRYLNEFTQMTVQ